MRRSGQRRTLYSAYSRWSFPNAFYILCGRFPLNFHSFPVVSGRKEGRREARHWENTRTSWVSSKLCRKGNRRLRDVWAACCVSPDGEMLERGSYRSGPAVRWNNASVGRRLLGKINKYAVVLIMIKLIMSNARNCQQAVCKMKPPTRLHYEVPHSHTSLSSPQPICQPQSSL